MAPAAPVAVPPHVFVRFGVAETTRPAGKVSVNDTPVSAVAVGFVNVIDSVELAPVVTVVGAKVLVAVGGEPIAAASAFIDARASMRPAPTAFGPPTMGAAPAISAFLICAGVADGLKLNSSAATAAACGLAADVPQKM